jgi:hypothetical protein
MKFLDGRSGTEFAEGFWVGPKYREVNTTGCFGEVTNWGMSRISIVVRNKAPGRPRGGSKRKNVSKIGIGKIEIDYDKATFEQLRNLRANLLTVRIMGRHMGRRLLSEDFDNLIEHITRYLVRVHNDKMSKEYKSDKDRISSIAGMMKKEKVNVQEIKSIDLRVERALFNMSRGTKR